MLNTTLPVGVVEAVDDATVATSITLEPTRAEVTVVPFVFLITVVTLGAVSANADGIIATTARAAKEPTAAMAIFVLIFISLFKNTYLLMWELISCCATN
jgi:hypothetical protein